MFSLKVWIDLFFFVFHDFSSSLEDTSKPKSTSEDVQKSASDWSKQGHGTQNLVSGESSPPIGQNCDKENENSSKVKEVSPKAKKRFVLKSSRKN